MTKLIMRMEKEIKQNQTMNLETIYYEAGSAECDDDTEEEDDKVHTVTRFKDMSGKKRPVSSLCWQAGEETSIGTAYLSIE